MSNFTTIKLVPAFTAVLAMSGTVVFAQDVAEGATEAVPQDSIAYREAYSLVSQQRWEEASESFARFLENRQDSEFADDAGYWSCYSMEQAGTDREGHFDCYHNFVYRWRDAGSNWLDEATQRLIMLGSQLARQGRPEFISEAMMSIQMPEMPDMPNMPPLPNIDPDEIRAQVEQGLAQARDQLRILQDRDWSEFVDFPRGAFGRGRMDRVDSELLALLSALRDDPRAGEILVDRLNATDNPEIKARLVLMLEDFEGPEVNSALIDLVREHSDEAVRRNAVLALLDRQDEDVLALLQEVARSSEYPVNVRRSVISSMDDWDADVAISILRDLLTTETNARLVGRIAGELMDIGSPQAHQILTQSYGDITDSALRREILEEMDNGGSQELTSFFTTVALGDNEEEAAIAIENLADREDDIGMAALDHIYNSTSSRRLQLAVIHGMSQSEAQQGVDFLNNVLQSSSDVEFQVAAVRGLGRSELESAVTLVIEAYRGSDDPELRSAAVRAMGSLRDYPEARDYMLEMLEQELDASISR